MICRRFLHGRFARLLSIDNSGWQRVAHEFNSRVYRPVAFKESDVTGCRPHDVTGSVVRIYSRVYIVSCLPGPTWRIVRDRASNSACSATFATSLTNTTQKTARPRPRAAMMAACSTTGTGPSSGPTAKRAKVGTSSLICSIV